MVEYEYLYQCVQQSLTGIYQDGSDVDIQFTSFTGNMTNSFTFGKKGWSAEISGWYRSKAAEGLLVANDMGAVNSYIQTGIQKERNS